jgi:hypothetical protein
MESEKQGLLNNTTLPSARPSPDRRAQTKNRANFPIRFLDVRWSAGLAREGVAETLPVT